MPRNVVVCDDDKDILEMISIILQDDNTKVTTVLNSLELMQEVDRNQPDLLLLDLWMPVLAGDQILRQLRSTERYATLPVIVMSASRDGEEIARNAGATDYIAKPFDVNRLVDMVERYL